MSACNKPAADLRRQPRGHTGTATPDPPDPLPTRHGSRPPTAPLPPFNFPTQPRVHTRELQP